MFNFIFPLGSLFLKQGVIWRLGVNNIYQMGACGSALMGCCVVGCCMWSQSVRVSYINKECVLRSCYLPDNYCILLHCVCFFCKKWILLGFLRAKNGGQAMFFEPQFLILQCCFFNPWSMKIANIQCSANDTQSNFWDMDLQRSQRLRDLFVLPKIIPQFAWLSICDMSEFIVWSLHFSGTRYKVSELSVVGESTT